MGLLDAGPQAVSFTKPDRDRAEPGRRSCRLGVLASYCPDVHRSKKGETARVARFPPLPRIPRAPTFPPDPRQAKTKHIVGALTAFAKDKMVLAGPNLVEASLHPG